MKAKEGFYGWIALYAAALSFFCQVGTAIYSFGAFLQILSGEMGWMRGQTSLAQTVIGVIGTLCAPLAGFLVSRYGARRMIAIGNGLVAIALYD